MRQLLLQLRNIYRYYRVSRRPHGRGDVRDAINRMLGTSEIRVRLNDKTYQVTDENAFLRTVNAFWFKAWAAGLGMTSVGLVIDDTGEHAYNIVVLSFGQGAPLSVKLVEPQTGEYATRNRDAGKYRLQRGIIII